MAELVAGEVVDVIVVLRGIYPSAEVIPKSLAEAVVVRVASAAAKVALASESENQGTAAIAVTLDVGSVVLSGLWGHLHVGFTPSRQGSNWRARCLA